MSAPNQVQSNPTTYYHDQYREVDAVWAATNPVAADTFASIIRIRNVTGSRLVTVEIILNGVGVGASTNIKQFNTTTAVIPPELRPSVAKYGSVMFTNSAGIYNTAGFILVNDGGSLTAYSSGGDFPAGSYIQNSTFIYYAV